MAATKDIYAQHFDRMVQELEHEKAVARAQMDLANYHQSTQMQTAQAKMQMAAAAAQAAAYQNVLGQQAGLVNNVNPYNQGAAGQAMPGYPLGSPKPPYTTPDTDLKALGRKMRIAHRPEHDELAGGPYHMLNDILTKIAEKLQLIQPEEVTGDLIDAVMRARE